MGNVDENKVYAGTLQLYTRIPYPQAHRDYKTDKKGNMKNKDDSPSSYNFETKKAELRQKY